MDRFLSMAILVYCALERYLFILIPQPSIVKTFQLGPHPPRRKFLALLVACIILVPSLLVFTPSARGSVTPYSFKDDFNYSGIDAMIAAGWTKCGNALRSFYSVANGILTLENNGTLGASM